MRVGAGESFSVVGFDIENRPLAYWWDGRPTSQITAICWKVDDAAPQVLLLRQDGKYALDGQNRGMAVERAFAMFRGVLATAGLVYGHNIRRHDLPIFQAWLERLQLPLLPAILTCDTLADYPKRKDKSASLENLAEELGLDDDGKKHMGVVKWERANQLEPEHVNETRERVVGDVLLQERLRARLLELGYLGPPRRWTP